MFCIYPHNPSGNDRLFYGNPGFLFTQLKGLGIVIGYSFLVSFAIFKFINWLAPMRVSEADEEMGLDATQHNEKYLQGTLLVKHNGFLTDEENLIAPFSEKNTVALEVYAAEIH